MKIKHFAGYGSVEAKKISKKSFPNEYDEIMTELKIQVKGNHEYGLERDNAYDLYHWLVKKFDKSVKDYYEICGSFSYSMDDDYIKENGLDVEVCTYTFTYKA